MSLFRNIKTPCPACGTPIEFAVVYSVNADRRAALRDDIMAGTFQQKTCDTCGEIFRMAPEFTYLHVAAGQFISVWPTEKRETWPDSEQRSQFAFDNMYGANATPAAAAIGRELTFRIVFGWEALREKLFTHEADIDDRTLELAKLSLMRDVNGPPLDADMELRLLSIDNDQNLVLGLFETETQALTETITVPKTLIDEIEAAPDDWHELRDSLSAGPFVDVARLLIEPAET